MDVGCRNQRLTFYNYYQCKTFENLFLPVKSCLFSLSYRFIYCWNCSQCFFTESTTQEFRRSLEEACFSRSLSLLGRYTAFGVILCLFLWLSISNELFIFVYAIVLFNCPFVWKKVRINNVAFQNCFSCYFVGVFLLSYFLMWKWWCCLSES